MPPLRDDPIREAFGAAADRLGWGWGPVPFAINSVPRDGRAACVHCSQCLGHACVVDAKNGTQNTVIPRALATGNCDLLVDAQVVEIVPSGGRARSVRVVAGGVRARCAASASSCARARSRRRGCCSSPASAARRSAPTCTTTRSRSSTARRPTPLERFQGPGHSVATLDFVHRDGEAWGGGVLFDAPSLLPVAAAAAAGRLGLPAWGAAHKAWMRTGLGRPRAAAWGSARRSRRPRTRVTADPYGARRARHAGRADRRRSCTRPRSRCAPTWPSGWRVWLREVGIERFTDFTTGRPAAAGEHSAGTCRMGEDPATSACDRDGRLHGSENVYVADASLLPTNGSVNPCLTTMANAWRVAEGIGGG